MTKWKCVCGSIHDGDNAPDLCPKCGATNEKFEKLADDKAQLVDRSRLSNSLHMRLFSLLEEVSSISSQGVEDNLDPGCLAIFKKAGEDANITKQMIKTEIQIHVGKGKWG
jgi:hypothetical protein